MPQASNRAPVGGNRLTTAKVPPATMYNASRSVVRAAMTESTENVGSLDQGEEPQASRDGAVDGDIRDTLPDFITGLTNSPASHLASPDHKPT